MNSLDTQTFERSSIAPREIRSNKRNDEMRALVCKLYVEGKGVKEIGRIIGRNQALAYKWVKQAGLLDKERRSGGSRRKISRGIRLKNPDVLQAWAWNLEWPREVDLHWANHPEISRHRSRRNAKRMYHEKKRNPEYVSKWRASLKDWQKRNIDRVRACRRDSYKRWRSRPENRIAVAQRRRFKEIMSLKNQLRTVDMIGCSVLFLRHWIERKWKRGMSWNNYGNAWCIDHVIPCASFDLSDTEQVKRCFHYSNLQPLTLFDNASKCDKIITTQPELCLAI